MPYERYTDVKLNHSCVIDESLWKRVQDKIKVKLILMFSRSIVENM